MGTKAIVLIETAVGTTKHVAHALRSGKQGIVSADIVTGPYDVIVVIEAPDIVILGNLVTEKIHKIPGVRRTITCIAADGVTAL